MEFVEFIWTIFMVVDICVYCQEKFKEKTILDQDKNSIMSSWMSLNFGFKLNNHCQTKEQPKIVSVQSPDIL